MKQKKHCQYDGVNTTRVFSVVDHLKLFPCRKLLPSKKTGNGKTSSISKEKVKCANLQSSLATCLPPGRPMMNVSVCATNVSLLQNFAAEI